MWNADPKGPTVLRDKVPFAYTFPASRTFVETTLAKIQHKMKQEGAMHIAVRQGEWVVHMHQSDSID